MDIELPNTLAEKINSYAKATGLSREDFLRQLVIEKLEDMDDVALIEQRLATPAKTLSHDDARRILFGDT